MRAQGRTVTTSRSSQPWICLSEFWKPPNTRWRLDSLLLKIVIKSVNISSVVSQKPSSAEALELAGQLLLFLLHCHLLSCTMWYIYALQYLFPLKYAFGLPPALAGFISHMVQDLSVDFFLFRPTAASPFVDPCYPNYLIFHRIANSNILLMWE